MFLMFWKVRSVLQDIQQTEPSLFLKTVHVFLFVELTGKSLSLPSLQRVVCSPGQHVRSETFKLFSDDGLSA